MLQKRKALAAMDEHDPEQDFSSDDENVQINCRQLQLELTSAIKT